MMLIVCDHKANERKDPPAWLEGAEELQSRDSQDGQRWHGIGPGYLCGPQPQATWKQLGDGYSACILKGFDPQSLSRRQHWVQTALAADLLGRVWRVPCILSPEGDRAFSTAYGEDFLPLLTDEQAHAEKVAKAARAALASQAHGGDPIRMDLAARWAADLIACVNHVTPAVLAKLGLLDDALIGSALYHASGFMPKLEAVPHD